MKTEIEKAIKNLAKKVSGPIEIESADAQRLTQAALNLAHVLATLDNRKEGR